MNKGYHSEILINNIDNFKDYIKRGNLDLILGKETPYYRELFIENYEPGTFTLYDRKINPEFLSEYERDFNRWLRSVIEKELIALKNIGELTKPFSHDLVKEVTHQVIQILNFRLEDDKQICELVYNQEYVDIIHRIILWLVIGDPEKELHMFKDFNELGFIVASNILLKNRERNLVDLLKWSIASGAIGVGIKGEDAATSPLASPGIELTMKKDEGLHDKIRFVERRLEEISMKGFSINFWPEFKDKVLTASTNLDLAWFTDDFIETLFDLKFIEKMLTKNDKLFVYLVPRAGRFVNDASYQDVMRFLEHPLYETLKGFEETRRFMVSGNGPRSSSVNGKKISKEAATIIANSDTIVFKGARTFETLQGLKKTAYFAFIVCREFSEAVTSLDGRDLPLVFVRQSRGERSFLDFKYRAKRVHEFRDGRKIHIAKKTALEYEKELRHVL